MKELSPEIAFAYFQHSQDLACIANLDGDFVHLNDRWEVVFGFSLDELTSRPVTDFIHPDDLENVRAEVVGFRSGDHETVKFRCRFRHRDGSWRWTEWNGTVHRGMIYSAARIVDAEMENEQRLRLALDAGGIGLWEWNLETNDLVWDETMFQIYGLTVDLDDRTFGKFASSMDFEERDRVMAGIRKALRSRDPADELVRIVTPDGETRYVKGYMRAEHDGTGKPIRLRGASIDVTREVLADRALETERERRQDRSRMVSLGEMAAGIGHEINNPLAVALGQNAILREALASKDLSCVRESLHLQRESLERIESVVQEMRTFARRGDDEITAIEVRDLVRRTVQFVRSVMRNETLEIEIEAPDGVETSHVAANPGKIQQILFNLVTNARDAMRHQEKQIVRLRVYEAETSVCIEVEDVGPGIPFDVAKRIFEPFFTTKEPGHGTGLGLSLSANMAVEMDGSLELVRTGAGGSSFRLCLPLAPPEVEPAATNGNDPARAVRRGPIRVLVVDDEAAVVRTLARMTEFVDGTPVSFTDPHEAMEHLAAHLEHIDVVISDYRMPRMDGVEFLERTRALAKAEARARPRLVLMTGGVQSSSADDDRFAVADAVVAKPLSMADVESILHPPTKHPGEPTH